MSACDLNQQSEDSAGSVLPAWSRWVPGSEPINTVLGAGAKIGDRIVDCLLGGCGNKLSVYESITSNVVATVIFNSILECENTVNLSQKINIVCNDPVGKLTPDSSGCQHYLDNKQTALSNWSNLIVESSSYNGQTYGTDYSIPSGQIAEDWKNPVTNGNDAACVSCNAIDFNQSAYVNSDTSCVSKTNIKNAIDNNLQAQMSQSLQNSEDPIGQIGSLLSGGSIDCMSISLTNKITQKIDDEFLNRLVANMNATQVIDVSGSSYWTRKFQQVMTVDTIAALIVQEDILNKLYTDEEIKSAQDLLYSNNSLKDLANALSNFIVSSSEVFSSLIGRMMLIVGILMITLFLIIGGAYLFGGVQTKENIAGAFKL